MTAILLMPCRDSADTLPRILDFLERLEPQADGYLFAEHNSTDNTLPILERFLRPKEIIRLWLRDNVEAVTHDLWIGVAIARQLLLDRARQLDPDFAIMLDSDVLPASPDLVRRLTGYGRDVVAALCPMRRSIRELFAGPVVDGSFLKDGETGDGSLVEMSQVGFGCVCLSRSVLQDTRLKFWPRADVEVCFDEDYWWSRNARHLGYQIFADKSIHCEHLDRRTTRPWEPEYWVNGDEMKPKIRR